MYEGWIHDEENSIAEIRGERQRKEESKRLFDEGMKHGHVLVNIVNMLVFGPAGTGKTNLKHLLTNKPPPLQRDSTPCMEKPVRIRPVSNAKFRSTGRGWEEMSQSKLRNLLAQIIAKLPKENADPSTASRVAESLKKMTTTELVSGSVEQISGSKSTPSSNDSDALSGSARMLDEAIDEVIASVVSGVAEELKPATQGTDQLSSSDQQEGELFDSNWVYVTDCGGQPQFHDISPLFIKHISVALVVLRLIDELSSFPSDEYYKDGQLVGSPHASHMTLGETLQSLIRSIESHTSQDKKPKMIFVGTFLDQLKSLDTLIKRNQEILDMLPPDIKKLLVYEDLGLKNLIFGLNTISRDDDSLATADRIRITVERSIPLQVKMPIWWSFLDSLLQSLSATLERGVLSKQECLRLATRFRYALQDLEAALFFFDEVCIAHYYPSILPNTVFVDAQIPLDKITELSQHAISLRNAEAKSRSTLSSVGIEAEWKRFRDEGIINLKFLRFFEKHYVEGIFSPEDMLLIMKELLVIAPIPLVESTTHQAEFFMPSLLKSAPIAELDKVRSSSVPLAIHFPSGCIRSGVFCCTVVDVMRRLGWEAVLPSSGPILFAKNCIQFRIPNRPCVISLLDSFSRMEVYVEAPPPLRKELCPMVCSQLMESIKAACVVLNYNNDTPKAAIFCPCKKSGNKLHVADVSVDGYWMCSLHAREWGELSDQHRIWLDNSEGSGKPLSATGTCRKTERKSDQQQYSINQCGTLANVVSSTGSGMSDQQPCLSNSVMGDVCLKTEVHDHDQLITSDKLSPAMEHVVNTTSDQHTIMEDVCKKTGVRDQQLDQEIPESDIILIAEKFPHLLNVHKALTINDLQHVYEKLHESASPHWFNLGLALGLTHPDLTNINIKCREDNVLCLREMLAKLLSTQHVTWSLLSDALRRPTVDLINLADSITGKPSSATGGTCTERKSDQQQYSINQCGTLANVVSSTGSGMSDQQLCLSNSVMEDVCLKTEVHDHDQSITSDKLSPAMEHVVNTTSDPHQHTSELSSVTVMEDVCKKTGVRDQQLNQEIPESDIVLIAEKFPHLLNVHKALTMTDLQHVYEKLKSASPYWFNLGLALGLSHFVLTNIDSEHRGNNVSCLREMLAKLLSTQHVTWSLLSDGLKRPTVDLINLADSITGNSVIEDVCLKTEVHDHDQHITSDKLSPAMEHVVNTTSDQHTIMEDVCKKTGVRDQQLNQEIPESDIVLIAQKFPHLLNVHKALTMIDLQHVYEKLKSASPHWFNLGLALGLSHFVLTNIDSEYRGNNVSCLREMLAKLLSTQHVTWSLLSDALKRPTVDLINLADSITGNSVMEDVCLKTEVHDHDQHITSDKLSPAMEHVVNTMSDPHQHTIMEDVCKKTGVRDQQLDQEILESDIILIAEKFPHLLNVHKALTIYDLQHVYEKLKSASPHWFDLGLALGLSYPDLTNIDSKHRGDIVSSLREMLAKLLSTQHVTWSLLSDGLKKPTVELINLADSITVNQSTTPNLLDRLNLNSADRDGVTDVTRRCSNQAGVAHALRVWQRVNPSRATFRALVEITIGLRRGDTATDICRFIVDNTDRN
ncbi:uncharacterized protein LOC135346990 isoform X1 [Halichondria panicea]|uniref:uncharacterized protein LOC135346990 isoform X1 n=1 Tax=Halichondria panicea TaxID=6063 RepID=UPI00312B3A60